MHAQIIIPQTCFSVALISLQHYPYPVLCPLLFQPITRSTVSRIITMHHFAHRILFSIIPYLRDALQMGGENVRKWESGNPLHCNLCSDIFETLPYFISATQHDLQHVPRAVQLNLTQMRRTRFFNSLLNVFTMHLLTKFSPYFTSAWSFEDLYVYHVIPDQTKLYLTQMGGMCFSDSSQNGLHLLYKFGDFNVHRVLPDLDASHVLLVQFAKWFPFTLQIR